MSTYPALPTPGATFYRGGCTYRVVSAANQADGLRSFELIWYDADGAKVHVSMTEAQLLRLLNMPRREIAPR